jgi:hypothetical protein
MKSVDRLRARGATASHSLSAPHSSTSKWRAVFQQRVDIRIDLEDHHVRHRHLRDHAE